jgi:hypothetical protein
MFSFFQLIFAPIHAPIRHLSVQSSSSIDATIPSQSANRGPWLSLPLPMAGPQPAPRNYKGKSNEVSSSTVSLSSLHLPVPLRRPLIPPVRFFVFVFVPFYRELQGERAKLIYPSAAFAAEKNFMDGLTLWDQ